MHSALLVSYYGREVMIDCGEDWRDEIHCVNPQAIVVTHAHPDDAWGLKDGAPCPVYATDAAWADMESYDIEDCMVIACREPVEVAGMTFEAFSVEHSTRAPAVGYRVTAGEVAIFYVPGVVYIHERADALYNAKLYVGDGATITRSMVRRIDDALVGHIPIRTQLTWCQKENVPKAVFTHCGSRIIKGDKREITEQVQMLAEERGVAAEIAYDGMERVVR